MLDTSILSLSGSPGMESVYVSVIPLPTSWQVHIMFFQEAYVSYHSFPLLLKAMLQSKKDNQTNCPLKQNLSSPFGHVKDAIHLCLPEN